MGKRIWKWALGLVLAVVLIVGGLPGYYHFLCGDTWVGSVRYDRGETRVDLSGAPLGSIWGIQYFENLESLDLRNTGMTTEQHAQILGWHPECEILWSVPFQDGFVDNQAETIRISTLSEGDIQRLEDFPRLKTVDAAKCQDYEALASLTRQRPDLDVQYAVELSGRQYALDSQVLTIRNGDAQELLERLQYLPGVKEVNLEGKLPEIQELDALVRAYPAVFIHWNYRMGPITLSDKDTQVTLSGLVLENTQPLEDLLAYGSSLETMEVFGSGLSHEDLAELQQKHPQVELVWDITIGGQSYRTDIQMLDLSGIPMKDTAQIEEALAYMPKVQKVDMCNCGLSSETMAQLNEKYEDVSFVWMINIGNQAQIRSDATYFYPYKLNIQVKDEDLTELKYCTEMVCIDVGHMPIYNCEWAANMHKLKYLIIADTMVDSLEPLAGLESLIFLETFLTAVTDYSPLLECPNLEDLNLCYTSGDPEPLTQMTWLKRLWWGNIRQGPTLPQSTLTMLREALPNTQVEFTGGSTAAGWRNHQNYRDMRDVLGMFYLT